MRNDHEVPGILDTAAAARALNRQPQTLRKWACFGSGPIRPIKIHGRLGWRAEDLRRLIDGEPQAERAA